MPELTEKEAAKLFEDISNAQRSNDTSKVSELMQAEATEEVAPVEEEKPEEKVEETPAPADTPEEDVVPEKEAPSEKTEEVETKEEDKPAPTELDTLKEQLEKLSRENHALKSQAGRVPYVQRRIKEIDKKLEELTKASPSSHPSAQIKPKVLEKLKAVRETDPELADAIDAVASLLGEATDGVTDEIRAKEIESLKHLRQLEVQTHQEAEAQKLLELYPNAPEVFNSTHWKEWKASQSSAVATLANSDSAEDVAFALEKYANDMLEKFPELKKTDQPKEATAPEVDAKAKEQAEKVEAERQRKQKSAVVIGSPSAPSKVGLPDDPNALFEKYSGEIRKSITG